MCVCVCMCQYKYMICNGVSLLTLFSSLSLSLYLSLSLSHPLSLPPFSLSLTHFLMSLSLSPSLFPSLSSPLPRFLTSSTHSSYNTTNRTSVGRIHLLVYITLSLYCEEILRLLFMAVVYDTHYTVPNTLGLNCKA